MTDFNSILPWISAAGVIVAILMNLRGYKRTNAGDASANAEKLTRIETTVYSVRDGVDDIRVEMRSQQNQINSVIERVVRVEESDKQAHKRIDNIEKGHEK